MCGRFIPVPRSVVDLIIHEEEIRTAINVMPDWPARPVSVYPGGDAALIVEKDGNLASDIMTWGFEVSWNKGVVFNTRVETALKPGRNMWTDSLAYRRCVVPARGFFEPHKSELFIDEATGKERKQQYLFTATDSPVLFLAGVFDRGRFSLMTTEPTNQMASIHARMPVVIAPFELETWFSGDYVSLFDRRNLLLNIEKAPR